jgi:branched-chain amino acid transport system substrate-binding protein
MVVRIGVLNDVPHGLPEEVIERAVRLGVDDVRSSDHGAHLPEIDIVVLPVEAHPSARPDNAAIALRELAGTGVVGVIGPAVSDNAFPCVSVADELHVPCINWSGSERARSEWMFHYQVGSLEDEPFVIAEHLRRSGWTRIAVVREDSIIGREYASFFGDAAIVHGLDTVAVLDIDVDGGNAAEVAAAVHEVAPDAVAYLGFVVSAVALATAMSDLDHPVVGNSAMLVGHGRPELASILDGWRYIDVTDDANPQLQRFLALAPDAPPVASPALFDMARLFAHGLVHAHTEDRAGLKLGLERVKRMPATLGEHGTVAGFGHWKRSALEGNYLVMRQWRNGISIRVT